MQETTKIVNLSVTNLMISDVLENIDNSVSLKMKKIYAPLNVDMIVRSNRDTEFKSILQNDMTLLADGMPLIWAAMFLGDEIVEKISGSDLFPMTCELSAKRGFKVFFLGSKPGIAEKAKKVLLDKYPTLKVVGVYSPPLGFENINDENQKIIEMINLSNTDILFIGLGSPKQEKWIWKYNNRINAIVTICVGASFDFTSGAIQRAPKWMQKSGLEWFWRLILEPKRLWRRYLFDDPVFFWLVLKQKLGLLK